MEEGIDAWVLGYWNSFENGDPVVDEFTTDHGMNWVDVAGQVKMNTLWLRRVSLTQ